MILPLAIFLVFFLILSFWHFIDLLQFLQQHEYLSERFLNWSGQHLFRVSRPVEVVVPLLVLILWLIPQTSLGDVWAALGAWLLSAAVSFIFWFHNRSQIIKPLVFTGRVRRLLAAGLLIYLAEAGVIFFAFTAISPFQFFDWSRVSILTSLLVLTALWLLSQLTAINLVVANLLTWPIEEFMRQRYIHQARRIINQVQPVVIGITGSYGKTSTKEILAHLLESRYEVLKTPRTFNTILGVCKVIREELKPKHKYFIVEMGAYKPGEIARICDLVHPKIAILTAVGPQHLERFKTVENVARAKYELIQALPADGIAIFNGDDITCQRLAQQTRVRTLRYGLLPDSPQLDLCADNVQFDAEGSRFDLVLPSQPPEPAKLQLLGRHNVSNALGAALAALQCDLSIKVVARSLASIPQLEHRLQVNHPGSGIITIDNAYNSNPSGAQVALEVLSSFPGERKVLVTPGFAELGEIEAQEHAQLGRSAGQVCDLIFLIGGSNRTDQIRSGIQETGFDPTCIYSFTTLKEARPKMYEVLKPGDVVLFENDLTDIY